MSGSSSSTQQQRQWCFGLLERIIVVRQHVGRRYNRGQQARDSQLHLHGHSPRAAPTRHQELNDHNGQVRVDRSGRWRRWKAVVDVVVVAADAADAAAAA